MASSICIDNRRQIHIAVMQRELRYVRQPFLIGSVGVNITVEDIRTASVISPIARLTTFSETVFPAFESSLWIRL